jgi:hypothetical protein
MADNGGPLNFRRGLDELQQGNAQSADSENQKAQMISAVGQRYSDSVDKLARNISSGVQGIIQNVQSAEELRMKRDAQRQQSEMHDWDMQHKKKFEPLEELQLHGNIDHSKVLTDKAKADMEREDKDYKQKQAGKEASDRALVDVFNSSGATKPKGWSDKSVAEQAAYAATINAEQDRNLKRADTKVGIDLKKSEIATSEVKRTEAIFQLTQKAGPEALIAMVKNPDSVVTKDVPEAQLKRTQEKWDAYNKSAQAYGQGQQLTARMFKIAGLKTTGENGTVSETDMDRYAEKMTGFYASFDNIAGDPKQQELKALMVEQMSMSAAAGNWRIQSDSDVKLAYDRMGSMPGQPNWDEGKFQSTLATILAGNGKVKSFYRTTNARANESKEQLKRDLMAHDGFLGIPMKEKANALYMQQPASMRDPKSSDYIPPDEFSKKSAQELYNSTFGINREKNEPNLVAPIHWQEQQQLDLTLRDPVESAKLIAQAKATQVAPFTFNDPSNQAIADNVNKYRRGAGALISSPAALAGVDKTKGPIPTTRGGEQVDPVNGNPNAPLTFSQAMLGESPGFYVVPQHSGKAAAGATPVGKTAEKYQIGVQKKFDLHPTWQQDTLATFK